MTAVPLQQLFVLNSEFMERQAKALAARLQADPDQPVADRIKQAFLVLFARPATEREVQWALEFLEGDGATTPQGEDPNGARALEVGGICSGPARNQRVYVRGLNSRVSDLSSSGLSSSFIWTLRRRRHGDAKPRGRSVFSRVGTCFGRWEEGFGALGLASVLADQESLLSRAVASVPAAANPLAPRLPHFGFQGETGYFSVHERWAVACRYISTRSPS